jgi:polyhydroxybutyrate depolymerase
MSSRRMLIGICLGSLLGLACSDGGSSSGPTGGDTDTSVSDVDVAESDGDAGQPLPDVPVADIPADQAGPDLSTPDVEEEIPSPPPEGSAGCGTGAAAVDTALEVGGQTRSYEISTPPAYDPNVATPLIFALHGLGGSGQLAQTYFGLEWSAGPEAIIVYPDALALDSFGGQTGWDLSPYGFDFEFFDALYAHLTEHLCVDLDRVFATGHSFGGYMSNSLGCYRSEVLDAIAPVAGGPPYYGGCGEPIGVWLTHGSSDPTVELSEGLSALARWRTTNGCSDETVDTDPSPCVAYKGCARDLHWCEHTGGHEWPAFAPGAIWDFFAAQ